MSLGSDRIRGVDPKVLRSVRIFLVVWLAMSGIVVYEIADGIVAWQETAVGVLAGIGVGIVSARMTKLEWDDKNARVTGRWDWIGVVILAVYVGLIFARSWIVGHWVDGPAVTAVGLAIVAGSMIGRILGTVHGIRAVTRAAGM